MSQLYMMVTVASRNLTKKFSAFYQDAGLPVSFITMGSGTASSEVLDYFGLDGTEKGILFHVVTGETWKNVKRQLRREMNIDIPGVGITFLVPLSSIGGKHPLNYLTAGQEFVLGEESSLQDTKYELLVVIANQGYSETVMDAARKVQASGGTVIHARGTGGKMAEKFLGVTLVPEKDMLFLVVRTQQKNQIMRSIMDEAGTSTAAGAIVFSLPVTDTAGMRLMDELEDET